MTGGSFRQRLGKCFVQIFAVTLAATGLWRTTAHGADAESVLTASVFAVEVVDVSVDPRAVTSVELGALEMTVMPATTTYGQYQEFAYGDLYTEPLILRVLQGRGSEMLVRWAARSMADGGDTRDIEIAFFYRDGADVVGRFRAVQCQVSSMDAAEGVDGDKEIELLLEPEYVEFESPVELFPAGSPFPDFAESELAQEPVEGGSGYHPDQMAIHQFDVQIDGRPVQVTALHGGQLIDETAAASDGGHPDGAVLRTVTELSLDMGMGLVIADMIQAANQGREPRYEVVIMERANDGAVIGETHYIDCLLRRIDLPPLTVQERPATTKARVTLQPTRIEQM